jgi:hypothetical protein
VWLGCRLCQRLDDPTHAPDAPAVRQEPPRYHSLWGLPAPFAWLNPNHLLSAHAADGAGIGAGGGGEWRAFSPPQRQPALAMPRYDAGSRYAFCDAAGRWLLRFDQTSSIVLIDTAASHSASASAASASASASACASASTAAAAAAAAARPDSKPKPKPKPKPAEVKPPRKPAESKGGPSAASPSAAAVEQAQGQEEEQSEDGAAPHPSTYELPTEWVLPARVRPSQVLWAWFSADSRTLYTLAEAAKPAMAASGSSTATAAAASSSSRFAKGDRAGAGDAAIHSVTLWSVDLTRLTPVAHSKPVVPAHAVSCAVVSGAACKQLLSTCRLCALPTNTRALPVVDVPLASPMLQGESLKAIEEVMRTVWRRPSASGLIGAVVVLAHIPARNQAIARVEALQAGSDAAATLAVDDRVLVWNSALRRLFVVSVAHERVWDVDVAPDAAFRGGHRRRRYATPLACLSRAEVQRAWF